MQLDHKVTASINNVYYTFCTIAFLWQSTLVSIDYFSYLVTSTINIRVPGDESIKPVTVCFYLDEVMNISLYWILWKESRQEWFYKDYGTYKHCYYEPLDPQCKSLFVELFTDIKTKFKLAPDPNLIGQSHEMKYGVSEMFLLGRYVCYQMVTDKNEKNESIFYWHGDASTSSNNTNQLLKFQPGKYIYFLKSFTFEYYSILSYIIYVL